VLHNNGFAGQFFSSLDLGGGAGDTGRESAFEEKSFSPAKAYWSQSRQKACQHLHTSALSQLSMT
jgi:hypothetical protein